MATYKVVNGSQVSAVGLTWNEAQREAAYCRRLWANPANRGEVRIIRQDD